jgi:hypothetical protein
MKSLPGCAELALHHSFTLTLQPDRWGHRTANKGKHSEQQVPTRMMLHCIQSRIHLAARSPGSMNSKQGSAANSRDLITLMLL